MSKTISCIDHLGNQFPSITAMCKYWKINLRTYKDRINKNWSQEKALTTQSRKTTCTDHLGNQFKSMQSMCNYWNVNCNTYKDRIQQNWSQEKALTTPQLCTPQQITDPFGNVFASITELCRQYHTDASSYLQKTKKYHYSQIEALKLIPNIKRITHWTFDTKLQVLKPIEKQYFLCIFDNHETIMHYEKIIEYCTEQLKLQYPQGD